MPGRGLSERALPERALHSRLAAGRVVAVDERSEREQRKMLAEGEPECEATRRDPAVAP